MPRSPSGRYPVVARGLPERAAGRGPCRLLPPRRRARPAARLGADARPALRRGQQRHRPPRGACRPDLRQDRHDPGESRRFVRRLCRRPGRRRVGRPRRQQVARQDQRRHRAGADLAQFHGLGAGRSTGRRGPPLPRRVPAAAAPRSEPASARARCPTEWSDGTKALRELATTLRRSCSTNAERSPTKVNVREPAF